MQNKKTIYFLLPGALLLWGYIMYQIVASMGGGEVYQANQLFAPVDTSDLAEIEDTFSLLLDYRDPFLGRMKSSYVLPKTTSTPQPKKQPPKKPETQVNWPAIRYYGSITNEHTKKKVYILDIEGSEYLAAKGDQIESLSVKEVYQDSIILVYQEETRSFLKEERMF